MKLTKKQRQFIRSNVGDISEKEMAQKLNVPLREVKKYAKKFEYKKSKNKKDTFVEKKIEGGVQKFKNIKDVSKFWKKHLDFFAVLGLVIALVYVNSIHGEFVSDDIGGIVNDESTHDLVTSLKTLRPTKISFSITYNLFELNPVPYHITNIVSHFFAVILAYTFISTLFNKKTSMLAALLFTLHPVNTEAISWLSGRVYTITASLGFSVLIVYSIFKNTGNKKYYWAALILYSVVLFTTNRVQSLIILLLLFAYDQFMYREKMDLKTLAQPALFLVPTGIFALLLVTSRRLSERLVMTEYGQGAPFLIRLPFSIYKAFVQLVFPVRLSLYHEILTVSRQYYNLMILVSVLLAIYFIYTYIKDRRVAGLIIFAAASVAYMFSPILVAWMIADRYLYIASLAFSLILVTYLMRLENTLGIKNFALITVLIISTLYSIKIVTRNNDWRTRRTLWEATVRDYPTSARAYNNLGDVYAKDGEYERAEEAFAKAMEIKPDYYEALHNMGHVYMRMGQYDKAIATFENVLDKNPNIFQANHNLAVVYLEMGDYDKSIEYAQKALQIQPDYELSTLVIQEAQRRKAQEITQGDTNGQAQIQVPENSAPVVIESGL